MIRVLIGSLQPHEHDAEVLQRATGGGIRVKLDTGEVRWIPDHWEITVS